MNDSITTAFSTIHEDKERVMTGLEEFDTLPRVCYSRAIELIRAMIADCKGLNPYWNCLQKALIAKKHMNEIGGVELGGTVVLGSCFVHSKDMRSSYGYEYNPPYEFHAWLSYGPSAYSPIIIDIALPGVIEKGLGLCDQYGPILVGRKPAVLFGHPPFWVKYTAREVYRESS